MGGGRSWFLNLTRVTILLLCQGVQYPRWLGCSLVKKHLNSRSLDSFVEVSTCRAPFKFFAYATYAQRMRT